jgi:LacI family transcriptional regulator
VAVVADVFRSAGSNLVKGRPTVDIVLRRGLREAIDELGYRPNGLPRQLARTCSTTIGLVTGGLDSEYFSEMDIAPEHSATRGSCGVMLCDSRGEPDRELRFIERRLLGHRLDLGLRGRAH